MNNDPAADGGPALRSALRLRVSVRRSRLHLPENRLTGQHEAQELYHGRKNSAQVRQAPAASNAGLGIKRHRLRLPDRRSVHFRRYILMW